MKTYENEKLKLTYSDNILTFLGIIDSIYPEKELKPFFESIVDEITENTLSIKFDEMKFMNSSAITAIIKFFTLLNEKKIKTSITYNENSGWQEPSFKALKVFCMDLNFVDIL